MCQLLLGSMGFSAAQQDRPPADGQLVRRTRDELKAMCREASRKKRGDESEAYRDSMRELAAKIKSLPGRLGVRAAVLVLVDRRPLGSTHQRVMVEALDEAGELNAEVANQVIRFIEDRSVGYLARGTALVVLLTSPELRNVAPRDDLEKLVEECMDSGHYFVRRRAFLWSPFLESPRLVRKTVEIARREDDERLTWWVLRGLGSARGRGIVPPDLAEEADRLIDQLHRKSSAERSPADAEVHGPDDPGPEPDGAEAAGPGPRASGEDTKPAVPAGGPERTAEATGVLAAGGRTPVMLCLASAAGLCAAAAAAWLLLRKRSGG